MANILIVFGSTGGNTAVTANKVQQLLEIDKHTVKIQRVENSEVTDLLEYDLCILACPTYGNGILEPHFSPFHEKMKNVDLKDKQYAVIGLGDYKYDPDYHFESISILEEAIINSNGQLAIDSLRILKSPYRFINNLIPKWTKAITEKLNNG